MDKKEIKDIIETLKQIIWNNYSKKEMRLRLMTLQQKLQEKVK